MFTFNSEYEKFTWKLSPAARPTCKHRLLSSERIGHIFTTIKYHAKFFVCIDIKTHVHLNRTSIFMGSTVVFVIHVSTG